MKYICNECGSLFDDDDLKCTCGSTDIEEIVNCEVCNEYEDRKSTMYNKEIDKYICQYCEEGDVEK